jgi:hypothetical protein
MSLKIEQPRSIRAQKQRSLLDITYSYIHSIFTNSKQTLFSLRTYFNNALRDLFCYVVSGK